MSRGLTERREVRAGHRSGVQSNGDGVLRFEVRDDGVGVRSGEDRLWHRSLGIAEAGFTWRLLLLSGLFILMGLLWLTVYTLALHAVGAFVGRPSVRTVIETVTGAVLVTLGLRLALQRR